MVRRIVIASIASIILPFLLLSAESATIPKSKTLPAYSPTELFKRMSPSVFIVEASGKDGKILSLGSGIGVDNESVVTNRHVIEKAFRIRIRAGKQIWPATLAYADPDHDLVRLSVPGLKVPPLSIRLSTSLNTGERVYAIGSPEGLELTLSEGLISGLRPYENIMLIQTTAPISPGSSGGGLFDSAGRLIGITTFQMKSGQNLNFALPCEWVSALPQYPIDRSASEEDISGKEYALDLFFLAEKLMDAREWAKAIKAYRDVLRLNPHVALAWYNLGVAYVKVHQIEDAETALRRSLEINPGEAQAWDALGYALKRQGRPTEAIEAHREALRLRPEFAEAWANLGNAHLSLNDLAQAIPAYREAIRLDPNDKNTHIMLAVAYMSNHQHAQAIPTLTEALRLDPDDAHALYMIGEAYTRVGERQKALQVYRRLRTLDQFLADQFFRKYVAP